MAASAAPRSVLIIGSEAVPFAKTGGLADVLGALPSALARLGWDVTRRAAALSRRDRRPLVEHVSGHRRRLSRATSASSKRRSRDGARAISIDCPELFDRDELYGVGSVDYPGQRATLRVARARRARVRGAAATARRSVVHAHDWQAALAPVYLENAVRSASGARRHARASSRFTTSRIRGSSTPTGCRASIWAGSSFTHRSPGVLGPHQLPEGRHQRRRASSPPSAGATPRRSRRRSSASASTASCARAAPISSAS